jgi:hypothetical protein
MACSGLIVAQIESPWYAKIDVFGFVTLPPPYCCRRTALISPVSPPMHCSRWNVGGGVGNERGPLVVLAPREVVTDYGMERGKGGRTYQGCPLRPMKQIRHFEGALGHSPAAGEERQYDHHSNISDVCTCVIVAKHLPRHIHTWLGTTYFTCQSQAFDCVDRAEQYGLCRHQKRTGIAVAVDLQQI